MCVWGGVACEGCGWDVEFRFMLDLRNIFLYGALAWRQKAGFKGHVSVEHDHVVAECTY